MMGYLSWASHQSGRRNAHRVVEEYGSVDALVDEMAEEIRDRRLSFRPIHRYSRTEPTNGKVRVIGVESVKQQVLDHTVVLALSPLLDAKVGFYQVASVPGKGQRLCRGALRRWVREGGYHVKLDVSQCYPSCSHDVVASIIGRYVRGDDVLYACESLLDTYDGGLEIGSYFSLRMMQLVLSFGYHHVESLHKTRRGRNVPLVTHQIWHMDDILLLGKSKRDLRSAARSLERYLREEFGLWLKPWKVAKTSDDEPLDLGGWVVRNRRCTMRPGTFLRVTRAFATFERHPSPERARRCVSYWGWFVHGDCLGVRRRRGVDRTIAHARRITSSDWRTNGKDKVRDAA